MGMAAGGPGGADPNARHSSSSSATGRGQAVEGEGGVGGMGQGQGQGQQQDASGMGQYLTLEELFVSPLPELCRVIAILVGIIGQLEKKLYAAAAAAGKDIGELNETTSMWLVDLWYPFAEEGKMVDNTLVD